MEDSEWFYLFLSPLYDFDEKKIVLRYRQAWSQTHPETHDRPTTPHTGEPLFSVAIRCAYW